MRSLVFLGLMWLYSAAYAVDFKSSEDEARYKTLTEELRCAKCQNQNLADSPSGLAGDLRALVLEMIEQGKSNQAIMDFMVARYGKFVLYRPPVEKQTMLLWFAPLFLVLGALLFLLILLRQKKRRADAVITPEEQAKIEALLNNNTVNEPKCESKSS